MATPGRLANPPIHEALVDFRTERAVPLNPDDLKPLWPEVKDRLPSLEVRNKVSMVIPRRLTRPASDIDVKADDAGFHGLFLFNQEKTEIAQFRVDGFTWNSLKKPYTSADDLFGEAIDLWQRFVRLSAPDSVVRVALRYINHLLLPFRKGDKLDRFLNSGPQMPKGTPPVLLGFEQKTVLDVDGQGTMAVVTQRLQPLVDKDEDDLPYTLDIDTFRTGAFPQEPEALLQTLESLRIVKNDLFFAFVTDQALQKYR